MSDNSKKVSQLPIVNSAATTDRIVLLSNASGNAVLSSINLANLPGALPSNGGAFGYVLTSDASGNASWAAFNGIYESTTVNTPTYNASNTDTVIFADPYSIGNDITIILPIDTAIEGKEVFIKNISINPGWNVHVTTINGVNMGSALIEDPVVHTFTVGYSMGEAGEGETWIHNGNYWRHTSTQRSAPIFYTTSNTYHQVVIQNANTGQDSSGDFVVYNDQGNYINGTGPYVDMGVDSSTYSNSVYSLFGPSDAYMYAGGANNLIIGTDSDHSIIFFANGTTTDKKVMSVNSTSVTANVDIHMNDTSVAGIRGAGGINIVSNNFVQIEYNPNNQANDSATTGTSWMYVGQETAGTEVYDPNGNLLTAMYFNGASNNVTIQGDVIPAANSAYMLGNSSNRWQKLWVSANSVIFADSNPSYPDQIITVSNGIFNILTANGLFQSNAGLRVGSFTFQNNNILLADPAIPIVIGSNTATAPVVFNRPITVVSGNTGANTLTITRDGHIEITTPTIAASDQAFSIVGSSDSSTQSVGLAGRMIHITGNDGLPSRIENDAFGTNAFPAYIGRSGRGTANTPSASQAGDVISRLAALGWGNTGFLATNIGSGPPINSIDFVAAENYTDTNAGSQIQFYTSPIGSRVRTLSATISSNGVIFPDNSVQNTAFNATNAVTRINVGTGLTQSGNVGIVGIDSNAVLSVTGTANQIIVANVGGNYTLSLPQNLNTNAVVQFGTLTVNNFNVTGSTTTANNLSVSNAVIHLAANSTSSSQIDLGGFTLGNTAAAYTVSILYNLANNSWNTGNTNLITTNLSASANVTANVGWFTGQLHAGAAFIGYDYPNADIQVDCNINSYNQVVQQNHNGGTQASVDFVAVNDIGNDGANYIDLGINSSTYANNQYNMGGPSDGYLYVNGGNLDLATQTAGKVIQFFTGNTTSDTLRATVNTTGLSVVGNVSATYYTGTLLGSANNTSFVGSVSAANVVSNAQLQANLVNYQTTAGLASNVVTLTSNLANYIVANTGLISNSSGVFVNSAYIVSVASGADNDSAYQTNAGLASNVATLTANNTNFVGTISAANVVSNAQLTANLANYALASALSSYQTTAGLASNVATLTSNNVTFVGTIAAANVVSNAQLSANLSAYVLSSALSSQLAGYQTSAGLAANVASLTSNNVTFVGTIAAANVVSNAQLVSNLSNYQTTSGLSSNVAALTSNNTTFVGTVAAANVVSNTQLASNLANYVTNTQFTSNIANYQTTAGLSANVLVLTSNNTNFVGTIAAANVVSNAQLTANLANYTNTAGLSVYQTTTGLASNVATLTANNTSFVGSVSAANVVSNAQLTSNLANYQTTAGLAANVATLAANNASYLGGVAAASYVNTAGAFTITGVRTHNANIVIGSTAGIIANGSVGLPNQYLTSNGSSAFWSTQIPEDIVYSIDVDRTLPSTANTTQSLFGVGPTLAANTKYRYRIFGTVYKSNTSFSSTGALQFAITNSSSTATIDHNFFVASPCAANNTQATPVIAYQVSQSQTTAFNTLTTISGSNTGATWYTMVIDGTLDISGAGTINPQIAFTCGTNIGATSAVLAGTTMELWPIGVATANVVIGTWA